MGILRAASLIAIISLISKVFGLVRQQVIAAYFGTTYVFDAFVYASIIPFAFAIVMLAGLNGPFHSSIVSVISKYKATEQTKEIKSTIFTVVVITTLFMALLTAITYFFAPEIINLLGAKLPQNTKDLAILELKIMSPMLILSGLIGISYGILNVEKMYFTPSFSPIMVSLSMMTAIFISSPEHRPISLAWGALFGVVLQFLLQLVPLVKKLPEYINFTFLPKSPGVTLVFGILLPSSLSSTIGQVNIAITGYFASGLGEGTISALTYANYVFQLPLGILLTALLVPILPILNESIIIDDNNETFKKNINKSMRSMLFVCIPVVFIIFCCGEQVIQILFQRGKFDSSSTLLTYQILFMYAVSLIFYAIRDLLVRVFYALNNAKIPFYTSFISVILIFLFSWILSKHFQILGIAFAISLVTIFNMILLSYLLTQKIGNWFELDTLKHLRRVLIATMPVTGICSLFNYIVEYNFNYLNFIILSILLIIASFIYVYILYILKDKETIIIVDKLTNKIKNKLVRV